MRDKRRLLTHVSMVTERTMSDTQLAAYQANCTTAARLGAEILPNNKRQLFDALAAAGIDFVTVAFD